jgi:hypothetical protein
MDEACEHCAHRSCGDALSFVKGCGNMYTASIVINIVISCLLYAIPGAYIEYLWITRNKSNKGKILAFISTLPDWLFIFITLSVSIILLLLSIYFKQDLPQVLYDIIYMQMDLPIFVIEMFASSLAALVMDYIYKKNNSIKGHKGKAFIISFILAIVFLTARYLININMIPPIMISKITSTSAEVTFNIPSDRFTVRINNLRIRDIKNNERDFDGKLQLTDLEPNQKYEISVQYFDRNTRENKEKSVKFTTRNTDIVKIIDDIDFDEENYTAHIRYADDSDNGKINLISNWKLAADPFGEVIKIDVSSDNEINLNRLLPDMCYTVTFTVANNVSEKFKEALNRRKAEVKLRDKNNLLFVKEFNIKTPGIIKNNEELVSLEINPIASDKPLSDFNSVSVEGDLKNNGYKENTINFTWLLKNKDNEIVEYGAYEKLMVDESGNIVTGKAMPLTFYKNSLPKGEEPYTVIVYMGNVLLDENRFYITIDGKRNEIIQHLRDEIRKYIGETMAHAHPRNEGEINNEFPLGTNKSIDSLLSADTDEYGNACDIDINLQEFISFCDNETNLINQYIKKLDEENINIKYFSELLSVAINNLYKKGYNFLRVRLNLGKDLNMDDFIKFIKIKDTDDFIKGFRIPLNYFIKNEHNSFEFFTDDYGIKLSAKNFQNESAQAAYSNAFVQFGTQLDLLGKIKYNNFVFYILDANDKQIQPVSHLELAQIWIKANDDLNIAATINENVIPRSFTNGKTSYIYLNKTGNIKIINNRYTDDLQFLQDRGVFLDIENYKQINTLELTKDSLTGDSLMEQSLTREEFLCALMQIHWDYPILDSIRNYNESIIIESTANAENKAKLNTANSINIIKGMDIPFGGLNDFYGDFKILRRDAFNVVWEYLQFFNMELSPDSYKAYRLLDIDSLYLKNNENVWKMYQLNYIPFNVFHNINEQSGNFELDIHAGASSKNEYEKITNENFLTLRDGIEILKKIITSVK